MATLLGEVKRRGIPKYTYRWRGWPDVETEMGEIRPLVPGSIGSG